MPIPSYRPLVFAIGILAAMALAAVNPWAGAVAMAVALLAIVWQLAGAVQRKRVVALGEPLSARDFAEMRRHYRRS